MKKIFVFLCFCILFNPSLNARELNAGAVINVIKKDPGLIKIDDAKKIDDKTFNKKFEKDEAIYIKSKKEIGENNYKLYRVFDRLIRANNLEYQIWRIAFQMDREEINATSSALNLVQISSGLYDSVYPNEDAIAFIISHELSHFLLGHMQKAMESYNKIRNYKRDIFIANLKPADEYPVFDVMIKKRLIKKEYKKLRNMEYEADREALTLLTKALYDTNEAVEAMVVLNDMPEIPDDRDTHPETQYRIDKLHEEIRVLNLDELQEEGRENLYKSNVLPVRKTTDKKGIVLEKDKKTPKKAYVPKTLEEKLIKKAYLYYRDDDLSAAEEFFKKAHKENPKNYIPALYLSYLYEYSYYENNNQENLKKAALWAKKAYHKNSKDKNCIKQKQDLEKITKNLKITVEDE